MRKFKFFLGLFFFSLFASCTAINDCQCMVSQEGNQTAVEYYDYEGNCAEMEEEGVICISM